MAARRKKLTRQALQKRWYADPGKPGTYQREGKEKPSRAPSGFELRQDGTYVEFGPDARDATREGAGSWHLEGGDVVVLEPREDAGQERRIRVVEASRDELVCEEDSP